MIIKDTVDSDVLVSHASDSISMAAGEMSMSVHKTAGNFIMGPVSFTSPFTNIRFNSGLFKLNSLLLSTMPSTIITPVPVFEFDVPIKGISALQTISRMVLSTVSI